MCVRARVLAPPNHHQSAGLEALPFPPFLIPVVRPFVMPVMCVMLLILPLRLFSAASSSSLLLLRPRPPPTALAAGRLVSEENVSVATPLCHGLYGMVVMSYAYRKDTIIASPRHLLSAALWVTAPPKHMRT